MSLSSLPPVLSRCFGSWLFWLDRRTHGHLMPVVIGILFAVGRRTVSSWLRAGSLGDDFRKGYSCLWRVGREASCLALELRVVYLPLLDRRRLLLTIDDSPTERFGPEIEGAGIHRNPAPGPAGSDRLWGHVWVNLAVVAKHPRSGARALPLLCELYVREKDVPELPAEYHWPFRTKLEIAAGQLQDIASWAKHYFESRWVVVDGAYAKKPFLRPAKQLGFVVVSRLRKDAHLCDVPEPAPEGKRGPKRKYGTNRIHLHEQSQSQDGWQQVKCVQYGQTVTKTVKVFCATWRPAQGAILVVLVKEEHEVLPLFCTDPKASAKDVLEAAADRGSHEETFKDQKQVWGADEQQVRNLYVNIGCYNLCAWMYGLVEAWAWDKPEEELVDRRASPWDSEPRRASHQDKRLALQRQLIKAEIEAGLRGRPQKLEIRRLLSRVLHLAGRYDFAMDVDGALADDDAGCSNAKGPP
jgi:hypothetical protein